jgi:hypothetical protein
MLEESKTREGKILSFVFVYTVLGSDLGHPKEVTRNVREKVQV